MDNLKTIISSHNKKISNSRPEPSRTCNCRNKSMCPLDGKCLSEKIVYQAEVKLTNVTPEPPSKIYFGIAETEFKTRYNNHTKSFRNRIYEKDTELSKYVWSLKDQNKTFDIKWSIFKKSSGYNPATKSCNLCLLEKLVICNFKDKDRLINKRLDLVSKCRHENKFIIANYSGID